jgi:hypothetical protein
MVTAGEVRLRASDGSFPSVILAKGATVVVPAASLATLTVDGTSGSEALLVGVGEQP